MQPCCTVLCAYTNVIDVITDVCRLNINIAHFVLPLLDYIYHKRYDCCEIHHNKTHIITHDCFMYIYWKKYSYINNVWESSYLGLTRPISWLLMPCLLASPGHQQPWYWLCRIGRSLSYWRKDFNCLCHVNVKKVFAFSIEKFCVCGCHPPCTTRDSGKLAARTCSNKRIIIVDIIFFYKQVDREFLVFLRAFYSSH